MNCNFNYSGSESLCVETFKYSVMHKSKRYKINNQDDSGNKILDCCEDIATDLAYSIRQILDSRCIEFSFKYDWGQTLIIEPCHYDSTLRYSIIIKDSVHTEKMTIKPERLKDLSYALNKILSKK